VPGHTLRANASHPDAAECVPERPNAVRTEAWRAVRLACAESEYHVNTFECCPCHEPCVATPAAEGLGVRWRWTLWAEIGVGLCELECLAPFVLFAGADGSKFCYTLEEYAAHLRLLHSELYVSVPPPPPPPRPAPRAPANSSLAAGDRVFPRDYHRELIAAGVLLFVTLVLSVLL